MAAPVADCLIGGIFEGFVAAGHGTNPRPQHLHLLYVEVLTGNIGLTHIDYAGHIHQGAYGGCGHTVLSGSGFGDDPFLAHATGQQNLPQSIVDFMGTGMVQVFTFEVNSSPVFFGETFGVVERGWTSDVITEQIIQLFLEAGVSHHLQVVFAQIFDSRIQDLWNVCPAEGAVITVFVNVVLHRIGVFIVCYGWGKHKKREAVVSSTASRYRKITC